MAEVSVNIYAQSGKVDSSNDIERPLNSLSPSLDLEALYGASDISNFA